MILQFDQLMVFLWISFSHNIFNFWNVLHINYLTTFDFIFHLWIHWTIWKRGRNKSFFSCLLVFMFLCFLCFSFEIFSFSFLSTRFRPDAWFEFLKTTWNSLVSFTNIYLYSAKTQTKMVWKCFLLRKQKKSCCKWNKSFIQHATYVEFVFDSEHFI